MTDKAIDELLKLIYGKDVIENAYASPAGKLTKAQARVEIQKQVTLGKISELEKLINWSLMWDNHLTEFAVTKVNAIDLINYKDERIKALQKTLKEMS